MQKLSRVAVMLCLCSITLVPFSFFAVSPGGLAKDQVNPDFNTLPGATIIDGRITKKHKLSLMVSLNQYKKKEIVSMRIYSEPSHTLLVSYVNSKSEIHLRKQTETAEARASLEGFYDGVRFKCDIPVPPAGDKRLKVTYFLAEADGKVKEVTAADALIGSFKSFGFGAAPDEATIEEEG